MVDLILTTFDWVPETPRGYVRDIRVRWALEEAGLPYRVESEHFFHVGRRPVFKWEAVVAFIEQGHSPKPVPHYRDQLSLWAENEKSAGKPVPSK